MRSSIQRHRRCAFALAMLAPLGAHAADAVAPVLPGTFFGSLPLGDCGEADALLRLDGHGGYVLHSHCRATLQDRPSERGRWSLEWNGTCVRLVADGLAGAREFAVPLDGLLVLTTGSCIEPVEDPRGRSLHRAPAGTEEP